MTAPLHPPKSGDALLAGGSGLIGREIARQWSGPGTLHLLLRRPRAQAAPRGQRDHLVDFAALPALPHATQAFCCLGTTIKVAGSQTAFRAVDLHAVLAFAQAARQAGATRLAVVSALGASPKSGSFYNRVKGEMEAAVATLGFECLVIARPSLLAGDRHTLGQAARPAEQLALALTRPLRGLIPAAWRPIEAATVARALRRALDAGAPGVQVLESAALQTLGQAAAG
jgi:uncharacterized protein YbjT (DUF2867 family)